MKATPCGLALALLFCVSGGGCKTSSTAGDPGRRGWVSPSLVMPGADWMVVGEAEAAAWRIEPGAWEYGRNDARLNAGRAPIQRWHEWAEVRNRNRTRTSNGRPQEFSTTFVRTYSLRQVQ